MTNVQMPSSREPVDNDDVPVTDEVVILLEANRYRKSALIQNLGGAPMRVTTDGSDPTPTHGKHLGGMSDLSLSEPCSSLQIKAVREGAVDTTANASEVS